MDKKSVLIIDKPKCCDECDICYLKPVGYGTVTQESFCPIVGYINAEFSKVGIHEDCPLKDMPVKEPQNDYEFETYKNGIKVGWNDSIDYLLGTGRWERKGKKDGKTEETKMP